MEPIPPLRFFDVSMTYSSGNASVEALRGLSFEVSAGEFVALIGPSGCGKSTALLLAAGLAKPSGGRVELDGKEVKSSGSGGYMPQNDTLFPWRTIRRNVQLGPETMDCLDEESIARTDALLKKYGLEEFADRRPTELSGGMRQRAALIRTLATRPEVLLLDEPFSALDAQTRLAVTDDVYNIIRSENKAMALVTHDISEAVAMADRIILLTKRPGTIKAQYAIELEGSPRERRRDPRFSEYFDTIWRELDEYAV